MPGRVQRGRRSRSPDGRWAVPRRCRCDTPRIRRIRYCSQQLWSAQATRRAPQFHRTYIRRREPGRSKHSQRTPTGRSRAATSCSCTRIGRTGRTSRPSQLQPVLHRRRPISVRCDLAHTLLCRHAIRAESRDIGPNDRNHRGQAFDARPQTGGRSAAASATTVAFLHVPRSHAR